MKMQLTLSLSALLLSLLSTVTAQAYYDQPLPRPCTGPSCVNPWATSNSSLQFQDTSVILADGTYYRFSKGNDTGLGLNVVTGPSLTGPWTYAYDVLGGALKSACGAADNHESSWRWAPEVHYINSTYYLFYTVETPDGGNTCFDLCVATAQSMGQDNWEDQGSMNIPVPGAVEATDGEVIVPYVRLDGNLLSDTSDPQGMVYPPYMVFGSYQFGLYGVQLSDDLLTMASGATVDIIIADQYQPSATGASNNPGNYSEGAYQLINGDYKYLFYSRGDCCAAGSAPVDAVYQVQVCRAAVSDGPTGPYYDMNGEDCQTGGGQGANRTGTIFLYSNNNNGNLASVFAPGSVGVINDPVEGLCMWYQYQNNTSSLPNLGFGYNYMSFDSEGWPILTASRS